MSSKMSFKDVFNEFIGMESRLKLYSCEIQGIRIWELIRWEVFNHVVRKLELQNDPHTFFRQQKIVDKTKRFVRLMINAILYNPLYCEYKKEILIFDHPRKMLIDGIYEDVYTKHLIEGLDVDRYEVLERHYLGRHFKKISGNRKYLDFITLSSSCLSLLLKQTLSRRISKSDKDLIRKINQEIESVFQVDINLIDIVIDRSSIFCANYKLYNWLFKKRKPKTIFIVVAYSHHGLVAAAKLNNVEVIELQHGVITPYNIAYSYPNNVHEQLKYFPDQIYLFGKYWAGTVHLPLKSDNIKIFGFPYLSFKKEKYRDLKKKNKQIVFLSQGTIGETLSQYAFLLAKELPDFEIIYKFHPSEYGRSNHLYSFIEKAKSLSNFTLAEGDHIDLHQLLAESEFQIGVSSAAIFEGLVFGCKTVLINSPSVEHLEPLIKGGYVKLAANVEELVNHIKEFDVEPINTHDLYCDVKII